MNNSIPENLDRGLSEDDAKHLIAEINANLSPLLQIRCDTIRLFRVTDETRNGGNVCLFTWSPEFDQSSPKKKRDAIYYLFYYGYDPSRYLIDARLLEIVLKMPPIQEVHFSGFPTAVDDDPDFSIVSSAQEGVWAKVRAFVSGLLRKPNKDDHGYEDDWNVDDVDGE